MDSVQGRIHRDSPTTGVIGDLEEYAKAMIGKPLIGLNDIEIGEIVSAEVDGEYVVWKADLYHGASGRNPVEGVAKRRQL